GGNNASASILAPHIVTEMLSRRHGKKAMKVCSKRNEDLKANAELSESKAMNGVNQIIYKF
ncbi:MAG TPA: hypothetical protein DCL66_07355, partial [Gammaproteobacteria bacterium]|nr:hypothetical protein [Gammaproteobacteria bacterium]